MTQSAKIIDLTRTFIPVKPTAFPETMHGTSQEDSPEQRVPVMAYKGYNFLPTPQGYKSFFGMNQKVSISDLPSRCDAIFIFMSETYENIFVALCEDGIWYCNGTVAGTWYHEIMYLAEENPLKHHDWSYCVIKNKLYAFQQGQKHFIKIDSAIVTPFVTMERMFPKFLNMDGQLGIFRANGRLGFWDSANSIGVSDLDDLTDFTPSILTLANVMSFDAVKGRIQMIRGSGKGFIIYATKSIIYCIQDVNNIFSWDSQTVLGDVGISYGRQTVASSPDTTQFASTTAGLMRIENGKAEPIVPEVTDFLRQSNSPIFLKLMENRFLALEVLDPDYLDGLVEFTENDVYEVDYNFPGVDITLQDAVDDALYGGAPAFCSFIDGFGKGKAPEQKPLFDPGDKKPGTFYQPLYTCHLSTNGIKDADNIVFGAIPCATIKPPGTSDPIGGEQNFCPVGNAGKTSFLTTDATNKTTITGAQAYIDGKWTIERFVAAQTALWKMEEKAIPKVIEKLLSKSANSSMSAFSTIKGPHSDNIEYCTIGRYVTKYSEPQFGLKKCEFWLTRYAIDALDIKRKIITSQGSAPSPAATTEPTLAKYQSAGGGTKRDTAAELCVILKPANPTVNIDGADPGPKSSGIHPVGYCGGLIGDAPTIYHGWECLNPQETGPNIDGVCVKPDGFNNYTNWMAKNIAEKPDDFAPIPETAYCTLSGWKYTKNDNTEGFIAADATCVAPTVYPSPNEPFAANYPFPQPLMDDNGSFCSKPFEPFIIPGTPDVTVYWPNQTLTLPPGTFLLQDGSIGPIYPDIYGAYVYDMQFKKWGKMQSMYKLLLDYSPINTEAGSVVDYARFGIVAGALVSNGSVRLFNQYPDKSEITYGKIGYYRLGFTDCQEVRLQMASKSTGNVTITGSRGGKNLTTDVLATQAFANTNQVFLNGGPAARWFDITVSGIFDLVGLEFRGFTRGRR